uniref:Protein transport protein sec16 n=1 Tax=Mastacembelus armatus TaxID=205130 RepID=A0A3Q3MFB8_9TELE
MQPPPWTGPPGASGPPPPSGANMFRRTRPYKHTAAATATVPPNIQPMTDPFAFVRAPPPVVAGGLPTIPNNNPPPTQAPLNSMYSQAGGGLPPQPQTLEDVPAAPPGPPSSTVAGVTLFNPNNTVSSGVFSAPSAAGYASSHTEQGYFNSREQTASMATETPPVALAPPPSQTAFNQDFQGQPVPQPGPFQPVPPTTSSTQWVPDQGSRPPSVQNYFQPTSDPPPQPFNIPPQTQTYSSHTPSPHHHIPTPPTQPGLSQIQAPLPPQNPVKAPSSQWPDSNAPQHHASHYQTPSYFSQSSGPQDWFSPPSQDSGYHQIGSNLGHPQFQPDSAGTQHASNTGLEPIPPPAPVPYTQESGTLSMFFKNNDVENEETLAGDRSKAVNGVPGAFQHHNLQAHSGHADVPSDYQGASVQDHSHVPYMYDGNHATQRNAQKPPDSQYDHVENLECVPNQEVLPSEIHGSPAATAAHGVDQFETGPNLETPDSIPRPMRSASVSSNYSNMSHGSGTGTRRHQGVIGTFIQQESPHLTDDANVSAATGGYFEQIDTSPAGDTVAQQSSLEQMWLPTPSPPKPTGIFQASANSSFEPVRSHGVGVRPAEVDMAKIVAEGGADSTPGNLELPPDNMENIFGPGHPLPAGAGSGVPHLTHPVVHSHSRPSSRAYGANRPCESPATTLWAQNDPTSLSSNILLAPAAPTVLAPLREPSADVIQPPEDGPLDLQPSQRVQPTSQQLSENLENPPKVSEAEAGNSQGNLGYASLLVSESLHQPVLIAPPVSSYSVIPPNIPAQTVSQSSLRDTSPAVKSLTQEQGASISQPPSVTPNLNPLLALGPINNSSIASIHGPLNLTRDNTEAAPSEILSPLQSQPVQPCLSKGQSLGGDSHSALQVNPPSSLVTTTVSNHNQPSNYELLDFSMHQSQTPNQASGHPSSLHESPQSSNGFYLQVTKDAQQGVRMEGNAPVQSPAFSSTTQVLPAACQAAASTQPPPTEPPKTSDSQSTLQGQGDAPAVSVSGAQPSQGENPTSAQGPLALHLLCFFVKVYYSVNVIVSQDGPYRGRVDPWYGRYDGQNPAYRDPNYQYREPQPDRPSSRTSQYSDRPSGYYDQSYWSAYDDSYRGRDNYYNPQMYPARYAETICTLLCLNCKIFVRSLYNAMLLYGVHCSPRKDGYDDQWRYCPGYDASFDDDYHRRGEMYGDEFDRRSIHSEQSAHSVHSSHSHHSRRSSFSSRSQQSQVYRSQPDLVSAVYDNTASTLAVDYSYGQYPNPADASQSYNQYVYPSEYPADSTWVASEQPPPRPATPEKFTIPHRCARFGPGGHLVQVLPNLPSAGQPALVDIHSMETMLQDTPDQAELRAFPGPLVKEETHKVDVIKFSQNKALECSRDNSLLDKDSARLLWDFIVLLCRQNGTVVGTDIADLLLKEHRSVWLPGKSPNEANLIDFNNEPLARAEEEPGAGPLSLLSDTFMIVPENVGKETERFRELLLFGRKKDALEAAMKGGLWGHALLLASKMDNRTHARVMTRFANSLPINDPLQTVYQLMSGRMPASATCCGEEKWGDWRPHLAMVLSNLTQTLDLDTRTITTMGDTLASKGLVDAAHFCYLMAQVGLGIFTKKSTKMVLIGSNHSLSFYQFATNEAIQRTEAYEYAQSLGSHMFMMSIVVFKLIYACRLAEAGLSAQAFHYCEVISKTVLMQPSYYSPVFICQLIQMCEKLRFFDPQLKERPEQELFNEPEWLIHLRQLDGQIRMGVITYSADRTTPTQFQCSTPSSDLDQPSPVEPYIPLEGDGPTPDNALMSSLPAGPPVQGIHLMPPDEMAPPQPLPPNDIPTYYPVPQTGLPGPISSYPPQDPNFAPPPFHPQPEQSGMYSAAHQQPCPPPLQVGQMSPHMTPQVPHSPVQMNHPPQLVPPSPGHMPLQASPDMQTAQPISSSPPRRSSITPQMDFYDLFFLSFKQSGGGGGWLTWFSRKGKNEAHLPDDKNKSIVWDEKKQRWVDLNEPEEESKPPPPPPSGFPKMSQMPQMPSPGGPPAPPNSGPPVNMFSRKAGTKSRYVDVLNPSRTAKPGGLAPAPMDIFAPLAPMPMPTNLFVPSSGMFNPTLLPPAPEGPPVPEGSQSGEVSQIVSVSCCCSCHSSIMPPLKHDA